MGATSASAASFEEGDGVEHVRPGPASITSASSLCSTRCTVLFGACAKKKKKKQKKQNLSSPALREDGFNFGRTSKPSSGWGCPLFQVLQRRAGSGSSSALDACADALFFRNAPAEAG